MRALRPLALSMVVVLMAACSSDDATSEASDVSAATATTVGDTIAVVPTLDPASRPMPIVGTIADAIAALEAQMGAPQAYFEINATSRIVNLFVSLNDGAVVQPWIYIDGELTSSEGTAASGGTFTAADLDFDPDLVLSKVLENLPGATLESFYVNGDGEGNVQYGVLVTSARGGGLDVLVGPTGNVLSVDPVN